MTSDRPGSIAAVHPPGGPPDRLALALFQAGEYDDRDGRLAAHTASCSACTAILAALGAVQADLAALPPTLMPAAVADRITAALRAEQLADATPADAAAADANGSSADPGDTGPGDTAAADADVADSTAADADPAGRHRLGRVVDLAAARTARRLRILGAVAAALVVLGGGGFLMSEFGSGSVDSTASGTAQEADDAGAARDGTGNLPEYDRASLEAAIGDLLTQDSRPETADGEDDESGEESGAESLPEALATDDATPTDTTGESLDRNRDDLDCLSALPFLGEGPLSVTRVNYQGRDAYVLTFDTDDPELVQVTVISAGCEPDTTPAVLDEFIAAR